jgi:hypothetical protein
LVQIDDTGERKMPKAKTYGTRSGPPKDPFFDFSKTIEIGKDSSRKIYRVVYSREAVE